MQSIATIGSFGYDDNGNLTNGAGRMTTWNSFDMPKQIGKDGATSDFVYGPEHQRTRQDRGQDYWIVYAGAQEVETKRVNGVLQSTVKTYWPAGVGVEIDRPGMAQAELSWTHLDRLGSPVALTDQSGVIREKLAYDAWGKRRAPDGSNTLDSIEGVTDNKGFTGHEMLDQLDLVHMNGRVYDPFTARFISADPYIQDTVNGQSYNRYSYVLNNPTNRTDPSGYTSVTINGWAELNELKRQIQAALDSAPRMTAQMEKQAINIAKGVFSVVVGAPSPLKFAVTAILRTGNANANSCTGTMDCKVDPLTGELVKDLDFGAKASDAAQGEGDEKASDAVSSGTNSDGKRDVKIDDKIKDQFGERGWTEGEVRDLANTTPTGTTTDNRRPSKTEDGQRRNDPASVNGPKDGGHIVVNDVTGEVVQVSNKQPGWKPDSRINWK